MNMHRTFAALLMLLAGPACADHVAGDIAGGIALPAEFRHARVFVVPQTVAGTRIAFYTDTGGGVNMLYRDAVEQLGLEGETVDLGGEPATLVAFPAFREGKSIPLPQQKFFNGKLLVMDNPTMGGAGFLGGRWFADRIWAFDYPAQTLHLLDAVPEDAQGAVALGFQVDGNGERTMHFPRMAVEIDGESMDMLLDTGATATLTESSAPHFDVAAGTPVGASFITKSTFEKWVQRHPGWLVVDAADSVRGHAFPMIRVPEVKIGGHAVGPVWFAQRPDRAFREYMSSMMDAPIEGAIGGSAFRYLRMVIDYPGAKAYFDRP